MKPRTVIHAALIIMALNALLFFTSVFYGFADLESVSTNFFILIALIAIVALSNKCEIKNQ